MLFRSGAVWQVILIAIGTLVYMPFIKTLDKQYLEEEASFSADSDADLDSIDLDSVTL